VPRRHEDMSLEAGGGKPRAAGDDRGVERALLHVGREFAARTALGKLVGVVNAMLRRRHAFGMREALGERREVDGGNDRESDRQPVADVEEAVELPAWLARVVVAPPYDGRLPRPAPDRELVVEANQRESRHSRCFRKQARPTAPSAQSARWR